MKDGSHSVTAALEAGHIAVFGASATPGKWGYNVAKFLLEGGYQGKVTLVNPRGGEALGLPLVNATDAAGADLAVICTPGEAVPGVLRQCAEIGIGTAIVQSGGFAEAGNATLASELRSTVQASGVRVIGPNCFGVYSSPNNLNVTNINQWAAGNVSIITQSGGVAQHVTLRLMQLGSGLDVLLALGNKVDIGFTDGLQALSRRQSTHGVLIYLERLDEGNAFLDAIESAAKLLPVTALISGRSKEGRAATMTHTGSMVSDWQRAKGLVEDAGAIVVGSLQEAAISVASSNRRAPRPMKDILVLLDGGGHSALLADSLRAAGYQLPLPDIALGDQLKLLGGPRTTPSNPFDIQSAGDRDPDIYGRMLEVVEDRKRWDGVVFGTMFGGWSLFDETLAQAELDAARRLVGLVVRNDIPVVVHTLYGARVSPVLQVFRDAGVPYVEWPGEVVTALRTFGPVPADDTAPVDDSEPQADPTLLGQIENVVRAFQQGGIVNDIGGLVDRDDLPTDTGAEWVLRLDGFAHKTKVGAIRLGIPTDGLPDAWDDLHAIADRNGLQTAIRVAPLVPHEQELIVTLWRDARQGEGILIGSGGTNVEEARDVAIGRFPADHDDVKEILERTRAGRHLLTRTEAAANFSDLVINLVRVFRTELSDLAELECNPVAVASDQVTILDALPTSISTTH